MLELDSVEAAHNMLLERAEVSRENERVLDQSFATGKRAVKTAEEISCDFTNLLSPWGGSFSGDLLDQTLRSPLFPGPGTRA